MKDPYIGKNIEIESDCELGQEYHNWTIIGRFSRKNNLELKRNDKCGDDFLSKYRTVEYEYLPKTLFVCTNKNNEIIYLHEEMIKCNDKNLNSTFRWKERVPSKERLFLYHYDMILYISGIFPREVGIVYNTYLKSCEILFLNSLKEISRIKHNHSSFSNYDYIYKKGKNFYINDCYDIEK